MKNPGSHKEFMLWFKNESEQYFQELTLDKDVYGFQHQRGTTWKEGLTEKALAAFQKELGIRFPEELIEFYRVMNGTDLPGVNVYGERGDPYSYEPICFSFPEHIDIIKELINERLNIKGLTIDYMRANNIPFIFPVGWYYYMVIDNITNPIFYISTGHKNHDLNQPMVHSRLYADSLQSWLVKNTFHLTDHISDLEEFPQKKRIANYWTD